MDLYRRIAAIRSTEDSQEIFDELLDRYGDPPKAVLVLLDVALLRASAREAGVTDLTQKGDQLRLELGVFRPEAVAAVCGLPKYRRQLTLSAGDLPVLTLRLGPKADVLETATGLVDELRLAAQEIKEKENSNGERERGL